MTDQPITDEMRRTAPPPRYACAGDCEYCWPADDLKWWRNDYYCSDCIDEIAPHPDDILGPEPDAQDEQWERLWDERHDGPSLSTVLAVNENGPPDIG